MQVFVTVNNVEIKINADVNVKNWLTKQYVIYLEPSNCECEFDKPRDVGELLDYKNCKCRKRRMKLVSWRMYWKCSDV